MKVIMHKPLRIAWVVRIYTVVSIIAWYIFCSHFTCCTISKAASIVLCSKKHHNAELSSHCTQILKHIKQEIYAQRAQISADPEDPDFGLWTPGSEAW